MTIRHLGNIYENPFWSFWVNRCCFEDAVCEMHCTLNGCYKIQWENTEWIQTELQTNWQYTHTHTHFTWNDAFEGLNGGDYQTRTQTHAHTWCVGPHHGHAVQELVILWHLERARGASLTKTHAHTLTQAGFHHLRGHFIHFLDTYLNITHNDNISTPNPYPNLNLTLNSLCLSSHHSKLQQNESV